MITWRGPNSNSKYFVTYSIPLSYQVKPMTHFIVKVILLGNSVVAAVLKHTCIFHCPFYLTAVLMAYTAIAAGCPLFLKQSIKHPPIYSH